jgi:hypothetical protein
VIPRIHWQPLLVKTACGLFMWSAISALVVLAIDEIAGP